MLDRSAFWSPADPAPAALTGPDLRVRLLPPVPQVMVSGDLDAFLDRHGLSAPLGLWQPTPGPRHALRLARNRLLAVNLSLESDQMGWTAGAAVSSMTGALAVIEIDGPAIPQLVARATAVDPRVPSASAALVFAGVTLAISHPDGALRLHVDRNLVPYLLDWCKATGLVCASDKV